MKTTKNTLLKIKKYSAVFLLLFSITSCTVDVPDSDTVPPKFSFKITGDGFDQTFNQDTDFSGFQLNLRQGATYDFILSGCDGAVLNKFNGNTLTIMLSLQTPLQVRGFNPQLVH